MDSSNKWAPMWSTIFHLKPERAWKGILDTKKQSLATFFFPNGLCSLVAHCGSFKRGFPDSVVAKDKMLCHYEMPALWVVLPAWSLTLSGDWAFQWDLWAMCYGLEAIWTSCVPRDAALCIALGEGRVASSFTMLVCAEQARSIIYSVAMKWFRF